MTELGTDKHFGTLLREARERKEISLASVSESIKVSQSCLQALERACWSELPPEIFVRGFVRSYARAIGVPEAEPLGLLDAELASRRRIEDDLAVVVTGATHELLPVDGPPAEPEIARKPVGLAIFVVVVLVISIVALSYLLQQPPPPGEGLSQLEHTAAPVAAAIARWLPLG
ncbi:MAG: helix-turn-helix transcriptional regulator [Deltaproteobacteria bacterium]|nr:helix-turn-helix transcriptional regulator [Deltaproteobacteria bacterium]